jgi:phosphatidylserine/phosphatidylglycerophosphate/cardiolipin synthase-like enzyme
MAELRQNSQLRIQTTLDVNPRDYTIDHIQGAKEAIHACVYKLSDNHVYNALVDALDRGVKLYLILDYEQNNSKLGNALKLAKKGAHVRLFSSKRSGLEKLHAKFSVYDSSLATAGSINWSNSASSKNLELIITFSDPLDIVKFLDIFDQLYDLGDDVDA